MKKGTTKTTFAELIKDSLRATLEALSLIAVTVALAAVGSGGYYLVTTADAGTNNAAVGQGSAVQPELRTPAPAQQTPSVPTQGDAVASKDPQAAPSTDNKPQTKADAKSAGTKPIVPSVKTITEEPQTKEEAYKELAAKHATDKAVSEGTQTVPNSMSAQARLIFAYSDGGLYEIYCKDGFFTEIQLQPGEEITYIGGGDTARWIVDTAQSGTGATKKWHISIKPLRANITTNFLITTDKHSYNIKARATHWYTPIISWQYPQEERMAFLRKQTEKKEKEEELISNVVTPEKMNFGYSISDSSSWLAGGFSWTPVMVFDDGMKTYIQMSPNMKAGEAPALFVKDDNGDLALVNYRVKNNYYIVDRLFREAELRNGVKEIVTIKRGK